MWHQGVLLVGVSKFGTIWESVISGKVGSNGRFSYALGGAATCAQPIHFPTTLFSSDPHWSITTRSVKSSTPAFSVERMGASPSVPFSDAQKAEITKKLLALYNDPANAGKSTEDLQNILVKEYDSIVSSFVPAATGKKTPRPEVSTDAVAEPKINPSPSSKGNGLSKRTARDGLLQRSFDRDGGQQSTKSTRKGPTRRRSFDQSQAASAEAKLSEAVSKGPASEIVEKLSQDVQSQSAPHLDVSSTAVDSWDSVSTQPYCDLCKMAFKNKAFLERHIKYSNLHLQNEKLAKVTDGEPAQEEKHPDAHHADNHPPHVPPPHHEHDDSKQPEQEEGRDYRLLYSGSKFYWRTQHTVDFDIYHHFATKTIEIIPHNNTHQKEMNRIYLNYDSACQMIQEAVDTEVENRVKAVTNDRFAKAPDKQAIREDVLLQKLVTYLLSRLHFEADDGHGKAKITALSQDSFPPDFLHAEHPAGLIPIKVTRRRRSTAEEIDETINIVHHSLNTASLLSSEATVHVHRANTWDENDPLPSHTPTHMGAIALNPVEENVGGD